MNSQQLLIINFIILFGLLLFFTLGRSKYKQTMRLNLKTNQKNTPSVKKTEVELVDEAKNITETQISIEINVAKLSQVKSIYFIYNGHEWEAHEVLGLPKGSSLQIATSQYQNLIKTSDPSTFEFYDAAYSAMLKTLSKSSS